MSREVYNSLTSAKSAAISELSSIQTEIDNVYSYLSQLQNRLSHYQNLVVDLDQKLSFYEQTSQLPATRNGNALSNIAFQDSVWTSGNSNVGTTNAGMSVREMVLHILRGAPSGLDVRTILQYMSSIFRVEVPRTTVSPQLSRMKQEGYVQLDGEFWKLSQNYLNHTTHG